MRSAPGGGGSAFVQLNRGKRSLALDPTTSAGNALLKKLIAKAEDAGKWNEKDPANAIEEKTVVLIRHGESTWNG